MNSKGMKKITLNRNGQTTAMNREVSDLKAGRFQLGEHVMLGVRDGDCGAAQAAGH